MGILRYLYDLIIKIKSKKEYESLAPISNIKKNATLDMLINAVGDRKNFNIALSGKYGAGKSSIVMSFFKGIRKIVYKPLYISLGMLSIEEKKLETGIDKNEFCQEIEKSIIQQIIYKENAAKLSESNIKRVSKLKKRNVFYVMIIILIFLLIKISSLFIDNFDNEIKNLLDSFIMLDIWWKIAIVFLGLIIIGVISKLIAKFIKKIDIKNIKFNFSNTEIDIEKASGESLINKFMDELVYFFTATKYNVVVIEDLDRFLKNEEIRERILVIFQKLKELSQVLNTSKEIKRKISFIYVVKDDLFEDEEERTKFFDSIVPVIPIISNYNSYAELKEKFEDFNINDQIMQDICTYINDYRVIKNLRNEYELYQKEIVGDEIVKEKQLAMLVLKNLRPREYEELLNNKGTIYDIIQKKEDLIDEKERIINDYIKINNEKINEYKKEKIDDFGELKRIAVGSIFGRTSNRTFSEAILVEQFLNSNMNYEKIEASKIYIKDSRGYGYTESEIFEYFGGKDKFLDRAKAIARKSEMAIEKLIIENKKYEKEKENIEKKPFNELLADNNLEINDDLIRMLLMNGYIDENYQDYMFKFKETKEIKKKDYTFISNVRQHRNSKFTYPIRNVEKVVEQIHESFFGTEAILNYNLVDFLITCNDKKIKVKQHNFLTMLSELNNNKESFIFGFIKYTDNKTDFLTKLYNHNNNVLYEVLVNNNEKIDQIELMIKNLLNIPDILTNERINTFIRNYLEEKTMFSDWLELNDNVKKSLILLNIKIKELQDNEKELIELVYINNLYRINFEMIKKIFEYKGFLKEDFNEKNLSLIMHDDKLKELKKYVDENKSEYITNCYLKTSGKQNNIEDIIECLNEWDLDDEINNEIIKSIPCKITDIKKVNVEYYEEFVKNDKIEPSWENYYNCYCQAENKMTDELVNNIELNIEEFKKRKSDFIVIKDEEKDKFITFKEEMLKNDKINFEVYKQIVYVCDVIIETLEEGQIEDDKLEILVKEQKIEFNDNNLQIIYNQIPDMMDLFIKNNINLFRDEIESFTINEDMICDIVKSENIRLKDKNKIINTIDASYINKESMEYIINNYSSNRISKINEVLKQKMFSSTLNINYKLTLLDKELEKNYPIDLIDNYIKLLPENYKYIADYESKPKTFSIPKTKIAEKVIEKLENKGFKFSKKITKNKIVISNKK